MTALARMILKHTRVVGVLVVLAVVVALFGVLRLKFDANARNLFRTDDQRVEILERIYERFASDDNVCFVLVECAQPEATLYDPAPLQLLHTLLAKLRDLEPVDHVFALDTLPAFGTDGSPVTLLAPAESETDARHRARDAALHHPIARARLITPDARSTILMVHLSGDDADVNALKPRIADIRGVIASTAPANAPIQASITGVPAVRVDIYATIAREEVNQLVIGTTVSIIICFVLFRRIAAVCIVTSASMTAAFWTIGAMGYLDEPINPVNMVVPTLVLIIAFTDAVHIVHAIRHDLAEGMPRRDAVLHALRVVGPGCMLTSLTTAIGFGSLTIARLEVIEKFGLVASIGTLMSFASVITIVPVLALSPLGRGLDPASAPRAARHARASRMTLDLLHRILLHPAPVTIIGVLVTASLAYVATGLTASSSLGEGIPDSSPTAPTLERIDDQFGGVLAVVALVEWDDTLSLASPEVLQAIQDATTVLEREDLVGLALSPLSFMDVLPPIAGSTPSARAAALSSLPASATQSVLRADLNSALVTAPMPDVGTHEQAPTIQRLEQTLADLDESTPGITFTLSGNPVAVGRSAAFMIHDLSKSLLLAAAIILIVMTIAFRSIVLGVISIVPNLFPLLVAASALVLTGHHLTITAVITFVVCLGIAVDDTIHVIVRYRYEHHSRDDSVEALERVLKNTGAALVVTTLVLVGGLSPLLLSEMSVMRVFGSLACLALASALLGDLIFLPALLALCKRFVMPRKDEAASFGEVKP